MSKICTVCTPGLRHNLTSAGILPTLGGAGDPAESAAMSGPPAAEPGKSGACRAYDCRRWCNTLCVGEWWWSACLHEQHEVRRRTGAEIRACCADLTDHFRSAVLSLLYEYKISHNAVDRLQVT